MNIVQHWAYALSADESHQQFTFIFVLVVQLSFLHFL